MEKNQALLFVFSVIAVILGSALYKQFDFETFKFEKPALAAVYIITFVVSIIVIVKNLKAKKQA
ncbi:hypothetical protein [Sphingobacterium sp. LRF_L2]|uniref:hypothetical protein n=1 Tax=Sphingobacterium sp. LRF_L2 TaxID=3369421 RepID=UPI003F620876